MAFHSFSNLIKPFLPKKPPVSPTSTGQPTRPQFSSLQSPQGRVAQPSLPQQPAQSGMSQLPPNFQSMTGEQIAMPAPTTPIQAKTAPQQPIQAQPQTPTAQLPTPQQPTQSQQEPTTPTGLTAEEALAIQNQQQEPTQPQITPESPKPLPPETQEAIATAEKAVQNAMQISPEEISAQTDLDNLMQSITLGVNKIKDQPIPMPFITGQAASVMRNALAQSQPLEAKLARMQAERLGSLEASKFALERADKKADVEREAREKLEEKTTTLDTKIFDLGQELVKKGGTEEQIQALMNAQTREEALEVLTNTGLFTEQDLDENIVVSPGGTIVNKRTGDVIFKAPKMPTEAETTKALERAEKKEASLATQIQAVGTLNEIIQNEGQLKYVSGVSRFFGGATGFTGAVRSQLINLKALTALSEREKLKGTGAVSDFEAQMLSASANSLNAMITDEGKITMGDTETIRQVKNLRGTMMLKAGEPVPAVITDSNGTSYDIEELTRKEAQRLYLEGFVIDFL